MPPPALASGHTRPAAPLAHPAARPGRAAPRTATHHPRRVRLDRHTPSLRATPVTDAATSTASASSSDDSDTPSAAAPLAPAPAPTSSWPPPPPATPPPIAVDIEAAPSNGRRLYATTDIAAPAFVVWAALTDYDRLGEFVPGLAENRCLARTAGGCTLLQVGQQSLALGLSFKARVVLDIQEHTTGLPASLWTGCGGGGGASTAPTPGGPAGEAAPPSPSPSPSGAWEDLYPQPRSGLPPSTPTRDISFAQVEGDFVAFRGVWRMQELRGGEGEGGDGGGPPSTTSPPPPPGPRTRLSYALYVRPAPWLPVHLVAKRVGGDVAANLAAVRKHAEQKWRGG